MHDKFVRAWVLPGVLAAMLAPGLASCGSSQIATYTVNPMAVLVSIDQLQSPDFTVESAAHSFSPSSATNPWGQQSTDLAANGFSSGATVAYFRDVGSLAFSNGPAEVISVSERFASPGGASAELGSDISIRESDSSQHPISTGRLGDQAHADSKLANAPDADQTQVVQITLEWRVSNLLNLIVVRGRYGGTRLGDALTLARAQDSNISAGMAPTPTAAPSRVPKASPTKTGAPPTTNP